MVEIFQGDFQPEEGELVLVRVPPTLTSTGYPAIVWGIYHYGPAHSDGTLSLVAGGEIEWNFDFLWMPSADLVAMFEERVTRDGTKQD